MSGHDVIVVAVVARRKSATSVGDMHKKKIARDLGRASYVVSIMGILIGFIIVLAVVIYVSKHDCIIFTVNFA
jgi:carbon starvation protein CstA